MIEKRPFAPTVLGKALWLVRTKQIQQLSDDVFLVKRHVNPVLGSYMVKKNSSGIFTCPCKGFNEKRICSHVIAVLMFTSRRCEATSTLPCHSLLVFNKTKPHAEKKSPKRKR